jgi:polyisoprenyl-phosphate glycosyltransferase
MSGTDRDASDEQPTAISIVLPCYNEAINLPILYERLRDVLDRESITWEMIAVDDHSADSTFEVLANLAQRDRRVRAIRLARNVGSHIAIMCGLDHSCGAVAIVMSADLQDPPEIIPQLRAKWLSGDQIVWAVRGSYEGHSRAASLFSRVYHATMAKILDSDHLTSRGADLVLIDRVVVDAVTQHREANLSLFAILAWLGFRQGSIVYAKEDRRHGRSGWTLKKKYKLFIDSVTAFSYFPIRFISALGIVVALAGCIYAIILAFNYITGFPVQGWTSLMVVLLVLGGVQITMLGILGEYLWRSLDESRRRPRYNVERVAGLVAGDKSGVSKFNSRQSQ